MTTFCWFPPDSVADRRDGSAGRMSNASIWRAALRANLFLIEPHAARKPMLLPEYQVLGDAVVEDESARVPVFGNVR